jgi:hypothetical protein
VFNGAKGQFFNAADGVANTGMLEWSELLTDEFTGVFGGLDDARRTAGGSGGGGIGWPSLLKARLSLGLAVALLQKYEPPSGRSTIGEAHALLGYAELLVAESFCAGTPLDEVLPSGGIQYGMPLTTDSLLALAQAHFGSAVVEASVNPTILGLASVGLGRTLLNRGQYAAAATAVHGVPTALVYNVQLNPNYDGSPYTPSLYAAGYEYSGFRDFIVADREGGNGLDFVSARDPRLLFDSTLVAEDGTTTWYLPLKFEASPGNIPLATGIEARLIEAEAALKAGQAGVWLADLNALRNSGCSVSGADTVCSLGTGQVPSQMVGLPSLADPGSDSGRVSLLFRERAFWLFGTGTRLGDLRRLIRQYGRDQSVVFPSGAYAKGKNASPPIPTYGTDVSFGLPTPQSGITVTNPNYKGCLSSPSTP